jgi:hypothetical protein
MQGSAVTIEGERVVSGVRFQAAGREFRTGTVVALDLTTGTPW